MRAVTVAGVDLGIIHPYAVAGPGGQGLLVSGRLVEARALAAKAPLAGQVPDLQKRLKRAEDVEALGRSKDAAVQRALPGYYTFVLCDRTFPVFLRPAKLCIEMLVLYIYFGRFACNVFLQLCLSFCKFRTVEVVIE